MENKSSSFDVDLVIVGGGPTGLLSAVLARALGLSVYIIGNSTFEGGQFTSQQNKWWTSLKHTHRPNFLMIGQSEVEEALLHQLDIPVDYNSHVNGIEETTSGVVVTTDKGKTITAKYAIAADGARSFVRTTLGIPFTGTKPEMVWAVLDTFIKTDFPVCPEIITFQKDGQSRVAWIPRTFISKDGNGRILLAGDAAHVHAVNGGQGLNTGIADAFNLIWRVAFVAKGHGGSTLLKSYDEERRATASAVIDVAAKLVRTTVKTALEYVEIIEKNAGYITGMGVSYSSNTPLVVDSNYGDFVAGNRCPDLWVTKLPVRSSQTNAEELSRMRLYELFGYGKFKVLFIGNEKPASFEQAIELQQKAEIWHIHDQDHRLTTLTYEFGAEWVKSDEGAVVVVRPDLYIGYVGKDWVQYLASVFN
ncbi:unnamed protein product [Aspergillus oryzae]|uniref:Unnamed protein product n=2 Tax=Aspergillus oryzae TaxID=5062 RepID=A0AAN5BYE1_ASPOZ|nr:unnamed protein product [Aspergillus oryzae]GMF86309.1 unnamed protein product [Aspergillus oryzae]GMG31500.1 unnamed protein product [Aspergillus oryzae]GMG41044.1 unnamed protein product [Aspergillus oryzae var. brunneus]